MDLSIHQSGAAAAPPSPPASPSVGYPTPGNPTTGLEASVPGAYWRYQIQAEMAAVLAEAGLTANHADLTQVRDAILALDRLAAPPGKVAYFCTGSPPSGYLAANGAAVSRATYALLFAAIGTTYGAGNGTTTFNLPDLRGEFIRGLDDGRGIDSGRAIGTAQKGTAIVGDFNGDAQVGVFAMATPVGNSDQITAIGVDALSASDYPNATATCVTVGTGLYPPSSGSDIWGVTRPRNIALLACIKY